MESYVRVCINGQKWKRSLEKYGWLPEKQLIWIPWKYVTIDEIGPYSYTDDSTAPKSYALTMIELIAICIGIASLNDHTTKTATMTLNEYSLCRYHLPLSLLHGQEKEFVGKEFQEMSESYSVQAKLTTVEKSQVNSVLKRVHPVVGNMMLITRLILQV
ncbi:hypothetical protein BBJ28_00005647 [Nothophytophthora sp. Chile5]|nr:hypothetical protein BBJ28_00005647 [Nothophytophthora sp. Chile5]